MSNRIKKNNNNPTFWGGAGRIRSPGPLSALPQVLPLSTGGATDRRTWRNLTTPAPPQLSVVLPGKLPPEFDSALKILSVVDLT